MDAMHAVGLVRSRGRLLVAICAAVTAVAVPLAMASSALASGADPEAMVLQPSDFRATGPVEAQGFRQVSSTVVAYTREYGPSILPSGVSFLDISTSAYLTPSALEAELTLKPLNEAFGSRAFARELAIEVAAPLIRKYHLKPTITVGRRATIDAALDAVSVPIHVVLHGVSLRMDLVALRVDRVVGLLRLVGRVDSVISHRGLLQLVGDMAANITSGISAVAPVDYSVPIISGTVGQGQTLTASEGAWSPATKETFAYQWQQCNAAGAACTAITGATSSSYAPTVTNAARPWGSLSRPPTRGSETATSAATTVVPGAP